LIQVNNLFVAKSNSSLTVFTVCVSSISSTLRISCITLVLICLLVSFLLQNVWCASFWVNLNLLLIVLLF